MTSTLKIDVLEKEIISLKVELKKATTAAEKCELRGLITALTNNLTVLMAENRALSGKLFMARTAFNFPYFYALHILLQY